MFYNPIKTKRPYSKPFIFFLTYEWAHCIKVLDNTWHKGLPVTNTAAYWANLQAYKKMKCCLTPSP